MKLSSFAFKTLIAICLLIIFSSNADAQIFRKRQKGTSCSSCTTTQCINQSQPIQYIGAYSFSNLQPCQPWTNATPCNIPGCNGLGCPGFNCPMSCCVPSAQTIQSQPVIQYMPATSNCATCTQGTCVNGSCKLLPFGSQGVIRIK